MALVTVLLVMLLMSALMAGFFAAIIADQRANGIDRDQTQAYAAAHAGLEKLTSSMATLFLTDYSPSAAQINALMAVPPQIPGFSYVAPGGAPGSGYNVSFTPNTTPGPLLGTPMPESSTGSNITSGPYAGFKGIITRYPITVTARSIGGAEVRLRRELQTVAVPVFQFGVFSETDLTFYAGDDFNFGGRVQTNGNLFLAEAYGSTLTLADRVTAFKEVVRKYLSNGKDAVANGFSGTVNVVDTTSSPPLHVRALGIDEGSITTMPTSPGFTQTLNPNWTTISTSGLYYKSLLRNGLTGAKYLSLPLVSQGALPIDLIRRPPPPVAPAVAKEDAANPAVFGQRYFSIGFPGSGPSMRILLSDTAPEITDLPTVTATAPVPLDGTAMPLQYGAPVETPHRSPLGTSPGQAIVAGVVSPAYSMTTVAGSTATTVRVASIPAFFKIPTTIYVGPALKPATCTGRTATTFTGCVSAAPNVTIAAAAAIATQAVGGLVPSGAGTLDGSAWTVTTASWTSTTTAPGNTITVSNVAPYSGTARFAPTSFWFHGPSVDGGAFTCSGYTTVAPVQLTGCTGLPATLPGAGVTISTGALEAAGAPLNRGFIKIEIMDNATPPVYVDVTTEILNLGISAPANVGPACDPTPNAVIRLQHLRDNSGGLCIANGNSSINSNDYWPNVLYDTREGTYRDAPPSTTDHNLALGGMMSYVSLDVGNLKRWLAGAIGTTGNTANNQNGAGYIVYFSDRRNNKCDPADLAQRPSCPAAVVPVETAEYGVEDFVNPLRADGLPLAIPRLLDVGEDVNAVVPVAPAVYVPVQDVYGQYPVYANAAHSTALAIGDLAASKRPWDATTNQWVGMVNRPIFFRRALKLVNGSNANGATSNLPLPGLTVASENPVYVQGNYNATVGTSTGVTPGETHAAAAILADAVTLLSNSWNDALSFQWPNAAPSRPATSTAFRFAVVSGKSLSFPWPAAGTPQFLFGTDGGVGNFLHLLEDWRAGGQSVRYRGSIVSLFISRQALGTFKYSTRVYDFADRRFSFDDDFLLPSLLPPGTPMFRDINTLTFRQLLRPNQ